MEWSNELTIQFLELYASERVIWDSRYKSLNLKHKVHEAWKRISSNMYNISIEDLKAKRKSLMATFRPLLKKKKASIWAGAGADEVFQPIWFAYDLMESFLGTIYDLEETINTEDEIQQSENIKPPPSPLPIQPLHSDEMPPPSPPQENTNKTDPNTTTKINAPRKRLNNTDLCLDEAQKKMNEGFDTLNHALKEKRGKRVEDDECDLYAKLLAKKLRKYPERMRDRIMYKVDGLLLDNPYPDEPPSSAYSSHSSQSPYPYYQNSTSSPSYIVPHSPVHVNMPEGNRTNIQNSTPHNYSMKTHRLQSPVEILEINISESNVTQEQVPADSKITI